MCRHPFSFLVEEDLVRRDRYQTYPSTDKTSFVLAVYLRSQRRPKKSAMGRDVTKHTSPTFLLRYWEGTSRSAVVLFSHFLSPFFCGGLKDNE